MKKCAHTKMSLLEGVGRGGDRILIQIKIMGVYVMTAIVVEPMKRSDG